MTDSSLLIPTRTHTTNIIDEHYTSGQPISVLGCDTPDLSCAKPDPCAKAEPCTKTDPCAKEAVCEPCAKPNQYENSSWAWLGGLVLWFIIFTVLFWLIFYSLRPSFVLQSDSNQVDTAKVLLAAVIAALILVIVIWLIKVAISRC